MKRLILHILTMLACAVTAVAHEAEAPAAGSKPRTVAPSYAWRFTSPLGDRSPATIDTLMLNYAQTQIPSLVFGPASAITGNYGTAGIDMTYFTRPEPTQFMFDYVLLPYLPNVERQVFYNTRIPMTLLGYETGGASNVAQDHFHVTFSGNINKRAQVGAMINFPYARGYYSGQAMKDFAWGLNGSYMADKYEMQAAFVQYNSLNKENGGITDDRYITDPETVQGGSNKLNSTSIPVNLTKAHNRVRGLQLLVNNRYRFGYYRTEEPQEDDTVERRTFVPVAAIAHTFKYTDGFHMFRDDAPADAAYWKHAYINPQKTLDETGYWAVDNSVGIELLEGFKPWAKFGMAAYLRHQVARYTQTADTVTQAVEGLDPYPLASRLRRHDTENRVWVGARIGKRIGAAIRYNAEAEIGLIGKAAGDLRIKGDIATKFRLRSDSMEVKAYAHFANELPSYFLRRYQSNHFMWNNDFGRTRRLRFGGSINIEASGTTLSAGMENVQNLVYFDADAMPRQHSSNIQIFSATLDQRLGFGIWHWDNTITYQVASNSSVLRLPELSVYSNMYLLFRIATLRVQFGVDCQYMTRYNALAYQPATMSFYNQDEGIMVGNYPLCNAYINMKLSKVRFFVMCSHVNRGLFGGDNYFSTAHNPVNPRRFQFGLTIDFAN